ncbi:hypothetical protein TanjilG_14031 [Lupinus angustifolius]|uniref:Uncharacterized protein n=1 Tax=Lupinus angustifolius TaxID=3871 RepID=A0A1J7FPE8_LUPAN|nr:hypothetical protein TanjilG_14031 [Lupinus angustifolius]
MRKDLAILLSKKSFDEVGSVPRSTHFPLLQELPPDTDPDLPFENSVGCTTTLLPSFYFIPCVTYFLLIRSGWTDLLDPATSTSSGTGSVNQPPEGMPVPPANPVAPGEADIRPVVAYPYQEDEMIGGQSVLDIRTRLLRSKAQPSAEEINLAHINAQDRFEVKVDIIQQMAVLDSEPSGDWTGRGARALDNPRAVRTGGEPSLIELYRLRDELHEGGVQSDAFLSGKALQSEVLRLGEEMFLVDAGPGTAIICMQDEPTGVPINRATRFEKKVGSLDLVAGESLIKKKILERLFIDLVAGESLIKERAAARFNDLVGSTDVVAGEPLLLLPRRFRQNRAWMELNKIWRTNTKKALLFLSAGSVIHAMSDEQDMRKMGGLASSFPFTYAMMLMGSLSLIGFPFLTGFYSKDVILELAYTKYTISDGSTSYNHEAEVIVLEGLLPRMKLDSVLTPSYADLTMKRQKNLFFDSQISGTSEKDWKVRKEVLDRIGKGEVGSLLSACAMEDFVLF